MDRLKKIVSLFLATLMLLGCGFEAFAAEHQLTTVDSSTVQTTITSNNVANIMAVESLTTNAEPIEAMAVTMYDIVDQSFPMTTTHRGADRKYTANNLRFYVTITDANGNATSNSVSVSLYNYNSSSPVISALIPANGVTYFFDVPITPGIYYYFKYVKSAGPTQTLLVHMHIYSHY